MSYNVCGYLQNTDTNKYIGLYQKSSGKYEDAPFEYTFKTREDWVFVSNFFDKFSIRSRLYTLIAVSNDYCEECKNYIDLGGVDVEYVIDVASARDIFAMMGVLDTTMIEEAVSDKPASLSADGDMIVEGFLSDLVSYCKLSGLDSLHDAKMLIVVE